MANTLTDQALSLEDLLLQTEDPECGAYVVFGGTVRLHNGGEGKEVVKLDYTSYPPLAEATIAEIQQETLEKFSVNSVEIRHRLGQLNVGEAAVLVLVRSVHRSEAFDAARYAIEAVKHRVAIWKEEYYSDGTSVFSEGCSLCGTDESRDDHKH
jgi:molybdopterin synthase catalytic subunit